MTRQIMTSTRLLFDTLIKHVYGEKKNHLNLDVAYEDIYNDIIGSDEELKDIKKNKEYPLNLFMAINFGYQLAYSNSDKLCNVIFQNSVTWFTKIIGFYFFPYGCTNVAKLRTNIIIACLEIYFIEDILKCKDWVILSNQSIDFVYDVKNKTKEPFRYINGRINGRMKLDSQLFEFFMQKNEQINVH